MKNFIILLLILGAGNSFGQNSLSGRIIDQETNLALIGATIYLPDLRIGTNTDLSGNYLFKNLPKGNFLVEIKFLGYNTKVIPTVILGDTKLEVTLTAAIAEIDEVVITGVSSATEAKRNPVPTTIVGKDALIQTVSTNLIDAIAQQPGISQISTGQAISKPIIRGLGYNRIISLYNGVRQEGQQWGDEHGMEIDEYSIDKVEIVKGPGSLMYGSDGIGGVVNFLSPIPQPDGKIIGNIITNYQTNNNLIGYSVMNSGTIKGISWLGRISSKHAGNYSNKYDGKVFNSGFKELDYNGFVGLHKSWGYSQLHFASFDQQLALPEGDRDENGNFVNVLNDSLSEIVTQKDLTGYKIGIPNQSVRHQRIYLANNFIIGQSRLMANVGYQLNRRQEFGNVETPGQYGLYFYLQTYNYDIKFILPETKGWKTSLGVNGMYQTNKNKGLEFLIPDYSIFDIGSYLFIQKSFENLNVSGGLRYERRNLNTQNLFLDENDEVVNSTDPFANQKFKGVDNSYNNYAGSLGLTYTISEKVLFKANVSRGYRAPNVAEISSNGEHEGSFRYEIGEPELKPETSLQLDLGLSYNTPHVTVYMDLFNNQIRNYIYAIKLQGTNGGDSILNPLEPVPTYKYGQSMATLRGGEIKIDIHPHPLDWLHLENTFSIVSGAKSGESDSTRFLAFMPAPRYQSEIRANFKSFRKTLGNVYAKVGLEHYFRQNQYLKENNTETATPAYTLVNAGIGSEILNKKGKPLFSFILSGNNLLNIAYQSHLSRLKYAPINPATGRTGIYNMGRNISLKIIIPLDLR